MSWRRKRGLGRKWRRKQVGRNGQKVKTMERKEVRGNRKIEGWKKEGEVTRWSRRMFRIFEEKKKVSRK